MSSVLPADILYIHQTKEGLVHQCGRLESVAWALTLHLAARHAAEIFVNHRRQPL